MKTVGLAKLAVVPLVVALATMMTASAAQLGVRSQSLTALTAPVTGPTTTTTTPTSPTVTITSPADGVYLRGTSTTVTADVTVGSSPISSVVIQRSPSDANTWTTICTDTTSPYSCAWTFGSDGDYDLRAVVTDSAGRQATSALVGVTVDMTAPAVSLTDPGSPLRGTVLLAATASDATSGVASVLIQRSPWGANTWTTVCTVTATPYSCYLDTTTLTSGSFYDFRAVATDVAGNTATSATVQKRLVDNTVSSITMLDPGAYLRSTVTLSAVAAAPLGVTSASIQIAPSGTTTWTTLTGCTFAAPTATTSTTFSCLWNSASVVDGLYDFRAVLVDGGGTTTISAAIIGRRVDNLALRGVDVQATNGGATVARLENGDSISFTYSEAVNPTSLVAGWTGATQSAAVRVRDGGVLTPRLSASDDTLDVFVTTALGTAVNLGSVNLRGDYVKGGKTAVFNATITATAVNNQTVVTVRFGSLASGGGLRTAGGTPSMVWTPSAAAKDLAGNPCSASPAGETGTVDKDF